MSDVFNAQAPSLQLWRGGDACGMPQRRAKAYHMTHRYPNLQCISHAYFALSRLQSKDSDFGPAPNIYHGSAKSGETKLLDGIFGHQPFAMPQPHSPRLLVHGPPGMGQTLHFCPALLGEMEKYPVFCLDLAGIFSTASSRSPEEACIQMFREAKRNTPSILYLPNIEVWWATIGTVLQTLFTSLINELLPQTDLLLLGSCTVQPGATVDETLPTELLTLFPDDAKARFGVALFAEDERKAFFEDVIRHAGLPPPTLHKQQMNLERGLRTRTRSSQRKQVTAVTLVPEALEKAKVLNEHEKEEQTHARN